MTIDTSTIETLTVTGIGTVRPQGVGVSVAAQAMSLGLANQLAGWAKLQLGLGEIYAEWRVALDSSNGAITQAIGGFASSNQIARISGGYIAIDAVAQDGNGAALLVKLQALGLQSGASFGAFAGGLIALDMLDELSSITSLAFARPVYATTSIGAVTSQDDMALKTDEARASFGVNGSGVTVGVLSDSFNTSTNPIKYAQDITSGDLPNNVNILKEFTGIGIDEGRAMAQLIYDIAPGANLAFYTAFISMADFANGIVALSNVARVIVDDVFYFAEPAFQDGIVAQAVDRAVDNGAIYFSSAGNSAARGYESAYRGSGVFVNITGGVAAALFEYHDFDPGAGVDTRQSITVSSGSNIVLQWDQPFKSSTTTGNGSQSEMAIVVFNAATGGSAIQVVNTANLNGDPIEIAGTFNAGTYHISIALRVGDAAPGLIHYRVIGGNSYTANEFAAPSGTSVGHSNAAGAIGVAAVPWFSTPDFGVPAPIPEAFTSRGGLPILFSGEGDRLSAPLFRDTVEFAATDGGNTTFFSSDSGADADSFPNFFGTSAAAPNAAAVAALLISKFPTATNAQITAALKASAIDIVSGYAGSAIGVGYDVTTGVGLIQAPAAFTALQAILDAQNSNTGAVAIIGYNTGQTDGSGNPATTDRLSIVTLEPLVAGQIIYITDRSWNGTSFTNAAGDGTYAFMVPAPLAAGEVITFSQGTLSAAGVDLSELGDTIYVYFGTNANTPTKFLNAVEIGDGNQVFDGSLANTGLSVGNGAVAVGFDSGAYAGPTTQSGALLGSGGATGLVGSTTTTGLWTGDDRDTVNAIEQAVQSGPWLVAADIDLVGVGAGGGAGIVKVSGDATVGASALGFNPATFFNGVTVGGNPVTFGARDIVFDAADGKFFIADGSPAIGSRILQGNIADLRNLSTPPVLTVLYENFNAAEVSLVKSVEVDTANNIVYFLIFGTLVKINYNTAGQAGTVLFDINSGTSPTAVGGQQLRDLAIDFVNQQAYITAHTVESLPEGDMISANYIYILPNFTPTSTFFAQNAGNTGTARLLSMSPSDGAYNPIPGTTNSPSNLANPYSFPIEYGLLTGLAVDPSTRTLYFSSRETLFNHDGNAGTAPVYSGGVIGSYALTGNATGTYTILHQQTALEGGVVPGKFGDIEVDSVTGRYYVLDTVGTAANLLDQSTYTGSLTTPGAPTVFATPGNVQGLTQNGFALNHAPTGTVTAAAVTATEIAGANSGATTGAALFTAASFSDIDTADGSDELAGAIVRISSNYQTGDTLRINGTTSGVLVTQGIGYSFNATTGALVLSGAATTAEYQAAIALVTFSVSGDNPTNFGAATTRGIAVAWSDGLSVSADVTSTITVTAVNDAPINVVPVAPFAVNEDVFVTITGLSVSDADASPTTKLSVTLSVNVGAITVSATILGGLAPGDITGNGTTSVTLSGTQAELNATFAGVNGVRYRNTGEGNATATLTMTTSDLGATGTGGAQTDVDTVTINVTGTNEAPVIAGFVTSASVIEQQLSVIMAAATVTDADSANFDGGSLTVSITFNRQVAQDVLGVATFGGITVSGSNLIFGGVVVGTVAGGGVGGGDLTIAFNVNATVAAVQDVVRAITYLNTSDTPTTTSRTISYTLVDGDGVANGGTDRTTVIQAIGTTAVNDAPSGTDLTRTATEDLAYTLSAGDFGFTDIEGNLLAGVVFTTLPGLGTLQIDADGAGGGGFTAAVAGQEVTAALLAGGFVRYVPVANANGTPYTSLTFQLRDNGTTTNGGVNLDPTPNTLTFNVTAVDDAPVAVADAVSTTEAAAIAIAVVGNDTDIDAGPKAVATINGTTAVVGTPIVLASGATVTLLADGTISYNPNGQFNYLITPARATATGAQTGPGFTSANDSFSYALNGGSSTTVTVTVTGLDSPGDRLNGSTGNDVVTGTGGADYIDASQGGTDVANGGEGNDGLYFGAAFTPGDVANGGGGNNDQLGLQGNYSAGVTLTDTNVIGIEVVALLPGAGFNYTITTTDALIAPGGRMTFYAGQLLAGQIFTLNAGAETTAPILVFGGLGTDLITTGGGNDGIYFGPGRFDPSVDRVNGGAGTNDQIGLDGDYTLTLSGAAIQGIEVIALLRGVDADLADYNLTLADDLVAGAGTITISGTSVDAPMRVDGALEATGALRFFGGRAADVLIGGGGADWIYGNLGNDTLTGNGGADRFHFANVPAPGNVDTITDFTVGQGDKIELDSFAFAGVVAGALAANAFVVGTAATTADHRVIYNSATGALFYDADGTGAGAMVQIAVLTGTPTISASDFVIV